MGYVDSNLLPNEQVTYRARLHRIIYLLPVCVLIVAIGVAVVGGGWIALGLGLIGLVLLVPPWIRSISSEFAVTNKRVLVKVGWYAAIRSSCCCKKSRGSASTRGFSDAFWVTERSPYRGPAALASPFA